MAKPFFDPFNCFANFNTLIANVDALVHKGQFITGHWSAKEHGGIVSRLVINFNGFAVVGIERIQAMNGQ